MMPEFLAAGVPRHSLWSVVTGFTTADWWTLAVACCCAVACALPGCFLVLRRMSMMGDAISHSILPGLAIAFLVTQSRDPLTMLVGAAGAGLVTAFLSWGISRWGKVPEDAALGVVFTSLFALGVILIGRAARQIDLDPGCVLYGALELTAIDTSYVGIGGWGIEAPRALLSLVPTLLFVTGAIALFFKELKIASFDPLLAASLGLRPGLLHVGLLVVVGVTSVVSFEAVGSVLVVAMLVAPGATAHLLTDRLARMLWLSAILAVSAATVGYVLAVWLDTSAAGLIGAVGGVQFGVAALLSPRHGAVAKMYHRARLATRIATEDVLGLLYRGGEQGSAGVPHDAVVGELSRPLLARWAVRSLRRAGMIEAGELLRLSPSGVEAARNVVRSHRLWESYLSRELGLPADHLHEPSHRVEHFISPQMQSGLSSEVGDSRDPHGKEIPR